MLLISREWSFTFRISGFILFEIFMGLVGFHFQFFSAGTKFSYGILPLPVPKICRKK